jgi:hypothetical protein
MHWGMGTAQSAWVVKPEGTKILKKLRRIILKWILRNRIRE